MLWIGYVLLSIDVLAALAVIAAFPIIFLTKYWPLACALFSTGLIIHFILHYWWPQPQTFDVTNPDDFYDDDFPMQ